MTWFEHVEKNNVKVKDIANAIDYTKDMQPLQQQIGPWGWTKTKE